MSRFYLLAAAILVASTVMSHGASLPKPVIVHAALGGQILGYDVDQNGSEGVLSEWYLENNGQAFFAIETFNQSTGKVKIVKKI